MLHQFPFLPPPHDFLVFPVFEKIEEFFENGKLVSMIPKLRKTNNVRGNVKSCAYNRVPLFPNERPCAFQMKYVVSRICFVFKANLHEPTPSYVHKDNKIAS